MSSFFVFLFDTWLKSNRCLHQCGGEGSGSGSLALAKKSHPGERVD
jgi:hypothetical protein